jgi:hypothetical protein
MPAYNTLTLVTADHLKKIGINVDLQLSDWGSVSAGRPKKDPPDQGGWNLFHTSANGAQLASPLVSPSTIMTCDGKNFVGWPCDEKEEALRQQYIQETDRKSRRPWSRPCTAVSGRWSPMSRSASSSSLFCGAIASRGCSRRIPSSSGTSKKIERPQGKEFTLSRRGTEGSNPTFLQRAATVTAPAQTRRGSCRRDRTEWRAAISFDGRKRDTATTGASAVRFATDSLVEEDGFELVVPLSKRTAVPSSPFGFPVDGTS